MCLWSNGIFTSEERYVIWSCIRVACSSSSCSFTFPFIWSEVGWDISLFFTLFLFSLLFFVLTFWHLAILVRIFHAVFVCDWSSPRQPMAIDCHPKKMVTGGSSEAFLICESPLETCHFNYSPLTIRSSRPCRQGLQ